MTPAELKSILPGDSIIGLTDDEELTVVHAEPVVEASRVVHVRSGAGSVPYLIFAGQGEILGQSRVRRV